jgi:Zn-dependent M28 family amino/carboxypeptidase
MVGRPARTGGGIAALLLSIVCCAALALGAGDALASAAAARPARPAPAAPAAPAAPGDTGWWAHVRVLADDKLEGRLTGTDGYRQAADYVARRFAEYGLRPGAEGGWFQLVRFEVQRVMAAESRLALVRGGRQEPLVLGEDALLGSRLWQPATLDAPLAFAGYGLHLPEAGYDDLARQDLRGKVVVVINGSPAGVTAALSAHGHSGQEFFRALAQAGAAGAISLANPRSMDIPWARQALSASQPGMRLADPALQDVHGPFFTATLNPARAEKLFAGSGHTLAELMALASAHKPMPRFPLAVALHAQVAARLEQVESPNVAAVLPGTDPGLRGEYVVLSAHLDHLGVGEPIAGDRIYNGAMDNAAGVAALLEIAHAMRSAGAKPRRSILFLAVCGEEKGLLGSRYFAAHPTVPPTALVANLNIDMFLPLFPLRYLTVQGLDESTLGDDARAVGKAAGVEVVPDREPDRNRFIRSDQYSFIRQGVPALAFGFAGAPGSGEEKQLKTWIANHYHAPSDDVTQPVDLAAAGKFNRLMAELAERVADEDARPAWKPKSFFRRFAGTGGGR